MANVEEYELKAKFLELKDFCNFAKESDYIELVEWKNGEGYDVSIHSCDGHKRISLTHGEFRALTVLINLM